MNNTRRTTTGLNTQCNDKREIPSEATTRTTRQISASRTTTRTRNKFNGIQVRFIPVYIHASCCPSSNNYEAVDIEIRPGMRPQEDRDEIQVRHRRDNDLRQQHQIE